MIAQSLWALLFGMIGIFVVMGIIALALTILNAINKRQKKDGEEQPD